MGKVGTALSWMAGEKHTLVPKEKEDAQLADGVPISEEGLSIDQMSGLPFFFERRREGASVRDENGRGKTGDRTDRGKNVQEWGGVRIGLAGL